MMKYFLALLLFLSSAISVHAETLQMKELLAQAELNNPRAQYQLSQAYLNGEGVELSTQKRLYWLEQAAQNRYRQAQLDLVEYYLARGNNKTDLENALFWLTKLAINGDDYAQYQLGVLYQKHPQALNSQMLAKLWYQIAAETNPKAEAAFAGILEQEFNQQRAKQLAQLESLNQPTNQFAWLTEGELITPLNSGIAVISFGLLLVWVVRRRKMRNVDIATAPIEHSTVSNTAANPSFIENQQLKQHISKQEQTLKKQQQQLNQLYQQLHAAKPTSNNTPVNQEYLLACAMFGFDAEYLPPMAGIKQRYKQLCKIYHPDLKGSDDEMKRLNQALKTIIDKRKHAC